MQSICDRLDGLPLAIEPAAASIKILPLRAILAYLERRLLLLGRGNRDAPARQRTMSATIDWRYILLADAAYGESLGLIRFIGDRQGSLKSLDGIAEIALRAGHIDSARRLTTDATVVRRQLGIPVDPRAPAPQRLPRGDYSPASADPVERVAPTVRQVVSRAIAFADELSGLLTAPAFPATPLDALTPRKQEILAMIPEDQADRDIASHVGISPRTIMHHVASIRSKLGVSPRTAVVGIALRQIPR